MDSQIFTNTIRGNYENPDEIKSKIVRIFLSSTFSDYSAERDYLIKKVYPRLKSYSKDNYNCDFQIIDMRWGISSELTNSHKATEICLNEIKISQKLSMGPNFIVLLSHRYGTVDLPTDIKEKDYNILKDEISKENIDFSFSYKYDDDKTFNFKNILQECYELDTNPKKPIYRLKYLDQLFPNVNQKETDKFDKMWNKLKKKLGEILRNAANICFDRGLIRKSKRDDYFISVTEKEIIEGVINAQDLESNVLFFEREIEDIESCVTSTDSDKKLIGRFIELDEHENVDQKYKKLLDDLKYEKVPKKLKNINTFKYKVKWNNSKGISEDTHSEYFKKFGDEFYEGVKLLIDNNQEKQKTKEKEYYQNFNKNDVSLFQEVTDHYRFLNEIAAKFQGREDCLEKIKKYILSESDRPLILYGDSGCGKTSILAKFASEIFKYVPNAKDYSVILRFLGTTPNTSNIVGVYRSISYQIFKIFNIKEPLNENNESLLKQNLIEQFELIDKNKKLVIILDSVDQLNPNNYDLQWLIDKFPKNIKMIYSTLPDHENIYNILRSFNFGNDNYIEIRSLDKDLSRSILSDWLKGSKRSLSEKQWKIIDSLFEKAQLYPLYVRLIFDITRKWTSFYDPSDEFQKCLNIDETIIYLFKLLEKTHGKMLFSRAITYMSSFRNGISENEIEDIISLDDDVLYEIFEFHHPPLHKFPSVLWARIKYDLKDYIVEKDIDASRVLYWYHRRFIEVAVKHYISEIDRNQKESIFANVVDFFMERWKNTPKPYKYNTRVAQKRKKNEDEEKRDTAEQLLVSKDKNGQLRYNTRKIREFPGFLGKLTPNLAFELAASNVFFNYEFFSAMFSCLPIEDIMKSWDDINATSSYSMSREAQDAYNQIKILKRIFLQCSYAIKDRPGSAGIQLLSRILIFNKHFNYFTKLINEIDSKSHQNFSLVVPYQFLPPPGNELVFSYDKCTLPIRTCVIGGDNDSFVFSLSDKLRVFNMSTVLEMATFNFDATEFDKLLVYFHENVDSEIRLLKQAKGVILIASQKRIFSYSLEGKLHFEKEFRNEIIQDWYILTKSTFVVHYQDRDYFEIFDIIEENPAIIRKSFSKVIKFLTVNISKEFIYDASQMEENSLPLLIAVVFESTEIVVMSVKYDADKLTLTTLLAMPPAGFDCHSIKFDLASSYLFATLTDGSIIKIFQSKYDDEPNVLLFKPLLNKEIKLVIKDIANECLGCLGSDNHIYIILDDILRDDLMYEISGEFQDLMVSSQLQIFGFDYGFIKRYDLKFNIDKLECKMVESLKINGHYDKITFKFRKDNFLLTASLDSTMKVFKITGNSILKKPELKFDINEKEDFKLVYVNKSDTVVSIMKDFNKLNIWKLSNGKIINSVELEATQIIQDAFYTNNKLILISKQFVHSQFIHINVYGLSNDTTLSTALAKYKIDIGTDKVNFHITNSNELLVLKEDSTQLLILIFKISLDKSQENELLLDSNSELDLKPLLVTNNNFDLLLTNKSNLLLLSSDTDLVLVDLDQKKLLAKESFQNQDKSSIKYFSSLKCVSKNSDNLVGLNNLNNLIYLKYKKHHNKLSCSRINHNSEKRSFNSFEINEHKLVAHDEKNKKLIGYNLSKPFSKFFEINLQELLLNKYNLSPNNSYVFTIENSKILKLFRIDDSNKVGDTNKVCDSIMYSEVKNVLCTEDYICMSMQDKRIIAFLIVDSSSPGKIKQLESRSAVTTEKMDVLSKNVFFDSDDEEADLLEEAEINHEDNVSENSKQRKPPVSNSKYFNKTIRNYPLQKVFKANLKANQLRSNWQLEIFTKNSIQFKKNEVIKSENESPTSTGTVASQACLLM